MFAEEPPLREIFGAFARRLPAYVVALILVWLLLGIGVLSAIAQYFNILAMKAGEASALAPLEYSRLIFATVLGLWLFAEWPEARVWIGAAIIVGAALFVLHRERRAKSGT